MTLFTVLMTIGFVAALVVVVGVALVGIIWATRTPRGGNREVVKQAELNPAGTRPASFAPASPAPSRKLPPQTAAPPRTTESLSPDEGSGRGSQDADPLPQPTGKNPVSEPMQPFRPAAPRNDGFPKPAAVPDEGAKPAAGEAREADNRKQADDEPPPEVRAVLKIARQQLASSKSSERVQGAEALGELGPTARSARRDLCKAMLDPNLKARTAAADALKKVDPDITKTAVAIYVNLDMSAVRKAGEKGEEAEPLTPLVLALGTQLASGVRETKDVKRTTAGDPLADCVTTLSRIAAEDEVANKFVVSMVTFRSANYPTKELRRDVAARVQASVRHAAIVSVRGVKHRKLAVRSLMTIAKTDVEGNRLAAIESLESACDENTAKAVLKLLDSMRYDTSPAVRSAVEETTERIRKKK